MSPCEKRGNHNSNAVIHVYFPIDKLSRDNQIQWNKSYGTKKIRNSQSFQSLFKEISNTLFWNENLNAIPAIIESKGIRHILNILSSPHKLSIGLLFGTKRIHLATEVKETAK